MAGVTTLVDMIHLDGIPNPSGHATMHAIALFSETLVVQAVADVNGAGATATTVSTIAAADTFGTGFCMHKLYGSENKGDSKESVVGDPDSQNVKSVVQIFCPGLKPEYIANKKLMNAQAQGMIYVTLADGQVMRYGSQRFPCRFKVEWGSDKNEGYRGYTVTATCYGDGALYTPPLNFTPAV